jgi:uncharacterized protein YkwD
MPRRRSIIAVALAALALGAPAAARADCPAADAVPAAGNLAVVGQATLCLLNEQRAANGLPPLTENPALSSSSLAYSQRMVAEGFFAHESPDGSTLVSRLTTVGYLRATGDWAAGENLGWGQADLATPGSMVTAWMNSSGHRENILSADYAEVGLGVALGTPGDPSWGATYTTDFGRRDAPAATPKQVTAASRQRGSTRRSTCARAAQSRKRGRTTRHTRSTCSKAPASGRHRANPRAHAAGTARR